MENNKKGFTLIEIIAVLLIVAILSILIIQAVTKYIQKGKDEYNKQLEQQLKIVGQDYFTANQDKLPLEIGNRAKPVWLANLKSNNFTSEEFVDANGGKCTKSYVQAEKTSGGYKYTPCLVCENYKSKYQECTINTDLFEEENGAILEPESKIPNCTVTLSNTSGKWTNSDVKVTIDYSSDEENDVKIEGLKVDDQEITEGIAKGGYRGTYEYKITKNGYNQIVSAVVRDEVGNTKRCNSKTEVKIDKIGPVCTFSDPYKGDATWEGNSYPRKGETVYYDLTCSDSESKTIDTSLSSVVSGTTISNTKSLKNLTGIDTINKSNGTIYKLKTTANETGVAMLNLRNQVVKDVAENYSIGAQSPAIYVWNPTTGGGGGELPSFDTSAPKCTITMKKSDGSIYNEGEWTNQNVTVTATCTPESNITYTPSQTITTEGTNIVTIKATNIYNSRSITTESRTIRIDKTPPKCTLTMKEQGGKTYENNTWTNKDVTVSINCNDEANGSGLKDGYFKSSESTSTYRMNHKVDIEGKNTITVYAIDNAGNNYGDSKTIKLDKTAPKLDSLPCYEGKKIIDGTTYMRFKYPWTDMGSGLGTIKSKHCYTSIPNKYSSSWSCAYQSLDNRSWDNRSGQFKEGNRIDSIFMDYKALPDFSNTESVVNTKWHVCDIVGNCKDYGTYTDKLNYKGGKYTSSNRSKCSGSIDITTYTRKVCKRKKITTYDWVDTTDETTTCNIGKDCCETSKNRTCNKATDVGNKQFYGCYSVTRYKYSKKQRCDYDKNKAKSKWWTTLNNGGNCSGITNCCSTTLCGTSTKGEIRYTGCEAVASYMYGTRKECKQVSSYTDWKCTESPGQTVCTPSSTDLEKVTCTEE